MAVRIPLRKYIPKAKQYDAIIRRHDAGVLVEDMWGRSQYFESHTEGLQFAVNSYNTIYMKKGEYNVGQLRIENKNGASIVAENAIFNVVDEGASTFTTPLGTVMPAVIVRNSNSIFIRGMRIQDSGELRSPGVYRDGVTVINSEDVTIDSVSVFNTAGMGMRITSTGTYYRDNPDASVLNTKRVHIFNCTVSGTKSYIDQGIKGFAIEIDWSENVTVESCYVSECQESHFRTHAARSVVFMNNLSMNEINGEPFDIFRSDHIIIKNNKIISDRTGIYIYEYTRNILVEGNDLQSSVSTASIRLRDGEPGTMENITIRDNTTRGIIQLNATILRNINIINNTASKLIITPRGETNEVSNIVIENNMFTSLERNIEIQIGDSIKVRNNKLQNAIYAVNATSLLVEGNSIICKTTGYCVGVQIDGNVDAVIRSNHIKDTTYQGILIRNAIGTNNRRIEIIDNVIDTSATVCGAGCPAIRVAGTDYAVVMLNRTLNTNGSQSISVDPPGVVIHNIVDKPIYAPLAVVKFNRGYTTENSGVATITAGQTRVTVNHGLVKAPTKVLVTPYANIRVWVENITNTSFDIVTDTAPTTNVQIAWVAEI